MRKEKEEDIRREEGMRKETEEDILEERRG